MTIERLQQLSPGDKVYHKNPMGYAWYPATVIEVIGKKHVLVEFQNGKRAVKNYRTLEETP